MNENEKALLSACHKVAYGELVTTPSVEPDEEAIMTRANELFREVMNGEGVSAAAEQAQVFAMQMIEANNDKNVKSPYQESKYDYEQFADDTIVPAIADIIKLLANHADDISKLAKTKVQTDEEASKTFEAFHAMSIESFKILNEHKVGMAKYQNLFTKVKEIVSYLEEINAQQLAGHRNEVLSRVFGGINPGTQKLDANYATYENLLDAREKAKTETDGPNGEDRFSVGRDTQTDEE